MYCNSKLSLLVAFCCIAFIQESIAQRRESSDTTPYHVNYWISTPVILAGAYTNSKGLTRIRDKEWLTPEELPILDLEAVNWFDRIALRQHSDDYSRYEKNSDFALTWGTLFPAVLIAGDRRMRKDWLDITLVYIETQTLTSNFYAWSFLGPTFIERKRPVTYFTEVPLEERLWGGNRNSFYSGHVAVSAVTTFFMAQSYLDYHPEKRHLRWLFYGLAAAPPSLIAYKRVQALKHFPSDVVAGLIIGAAGATLIPKLHQRPKLKNMSLGFVYEPNLKIVRCVWTL